MGTLRHLLPRWRTHAAQHMTRTSNLADGVSVRLLPTGGQWARGLKEVPWHAVVDVLLYAAAVAVGFLNMLIVMTYNPGLIAAVVLGESMGLIACKVNSCRRLASASTARAPPAPSDGPSVLDLERGGSPCH